MWWNVLLGLLLAVVLVLNFGPREPVDYTVSFSESDLGEDLDAYLSAAEARMDGVVPEHAKSIVWAGAAGAKTDYSVVYLHGFSATKEEIRPVPDRVAQALDANLFFTRLTGHGRTAEAMSQATVNDWINDAAEAMAIGRRLGEKVVVISTSTGGTVFTLMAFDPALTRDVAAVVFMSPNFEIAASGSAILTWPFARQIVPLILGDERSWEPMSDVQAKHWHTRYPSDAVLPMAAAVREASNVPVSEIRIPAFFIFSPDDQVVSASATRAVAENWGGPVKIWEMSGSEVGDASAHVLAGDIVSPQTTTPVSDAISGWIKGLQ